MGSNSGNSIQGKVCDGQPLCTDYKITIEVINDSPYLSSKLNDLTVKIGESKIYKLPSAIDKERQTCIIKAKKMDGGALPSFIAF